MSKSRPKMNPIHILTQGVPEWGQPAWLRFEKPAAILAARDVSEVRPILRAVEDATRNGQWAVGFVCYEAAAAFDPALKTHAPDFLPLAWFAIFDGWQPANDPSNTAASLHLEPSLNETTYRETVARIKECIARGETYQVNYTFPLRGRDTSEPAARFAALYQAQHCRYATFIETPDFAICSASPELFFQQSGSHLVCRPMKGTARRGRWASEDEAIAGRLRNSSKERAENVMIVDMMRNDLGRIAKPGSVRTTRLFEVERLPTVWQMTSTVEAESDAGLDAIFAALFPCASVTGAPKVETMRIIRELEPGPRGVYTGAIGFVGPDRRARFNVAIRTLAVDKTNSRVTYGVGSGVVWDSDPAREYAECIAKSLVLETTESFSLFTTLRWEPGIGCALWPRHVARLEHAAAHFEYPFIAARLQQAFEKATQAFPAAPQRVRVLIHVNGEIAIEHQPLPVANPTRVAPAKEPLNTDSPFLFHKTTRRAFYEQARAARIDVDDVLLWNEAGEITESTIANVAVKMDGHWITPAVECGLLGGVMREELLARGEWTEGRILRKDVPPGTEIHLANAVRGVWCATVVD